MSSEHGLWFTNNLENFLVVRGLNDAVVKLYDKHVLLIASQCFCDELAVLNLVNVESSIKLSHIEILVFRRQKM